jgi:SnoaL-like protein
MRGTQALHRYYEDWMGTFGGLQAEVEEVIFESDELCAVLVHNFGRPTGSSSLVHGRYYVICKVRQGRI